MSDSQLDQKRLKELREYITKLSLLQAQLRKLLRHYVDQTGDSANTVAQKVNSTWATVAGLLEGERVVLKDALVGNLARVVGMSNETAGEIIDLGKKVPHRYLGLAALDRKVIDIVFDLMVAHNAVSKEYSMAEFAQAFAPHEQAVLGALNLLRDALMSLQRDSQVMDAILEVLLDDVALERKLKEIKNTQSRRRLEVIAKVDQLIAELLPGYNDKVSLVRDLGFAQGSLDRAKLMGASDAQISRFLTVLEAAVCKDAPSGDIHSLKELYGELHSRYGSQSAVARLLDVPSSTLSDALHGKVSPDRLARLIAKATERTNQPDGPKNEANPRVEPSRVTNSKSVASVESSSTDPFHGLAGGTIQGVRHVLTADNFREIEGLSAEAVVNALIISTQTTTGLLALIAQMKGDEIRRLMRQPRVARMLRALYDALEIAANSDPTPLLQMFDQQRAMWGAMIDSGKEKGSVAHD